MAAGAVLMSVLVASPAEAADLVLHASPNGVGDCSTAAAPCSLPVAQGQVRTLVAAGLTGSVTVELAGGTYRSPSPVDGTPILSLDRSDQGAGADKRVIYKNAAGATPVFDGGMPLTGWTVDTSGAVTPDGGAQVYSTTVPRDFTSRQIWVDGQVAQLARQAAAVLNLGTVKVDVDDNPTGYAFENAGSPASSWPDAAGMRLGWIGGGDNPGSPVSYFTDVTCDVDSVTSAGMTMTESCFEVARDQRAQITVSKPTFVENARELLKTAGQFYIDPTATATSGRIYYIPRPGEDLSTASVVAPVQTTLLEISGYPGTAGLPVATNGHDRAKFLSIEGITFEHAGWNPSESEGVVTQQTNNLLSKNPLSGPDVPPFLVRRPDAAVEVHAGGQIELTGNTVRHVGGNGINFDKGSANSMILRNTVTDVAGDGIAVGQTAHGRNETSKVPNLVSYLDQAHTIEDNLVYDFGNRWTSAAGINLGYVKDMTVRHNEVGHSPYIGIELGWGFGRPDKGQANNRITYNYVHDVMTSSLRDGGGIYVNGANAPGASAETSSVISNNHVSRVGGQQAHALYLDAGSSYWTVANNLVTGSNVSWLGMQTGSGDTAFQLTNHNTATENWVGGPDVHTVPAEPTNVVTNNHFNVTAPLPAAAQAIKDNAVLLTPRPDVVTDGNLAQGKAVVVSSLKDASTNPAAAAVDGVNVGGWASTVDDPGAYLRVDLGAQYSLSDIRMVTRAGDNDQDATRRSFVVEVFNTPGDPAKTLVCSVGKNTLGKREPLECPVLGTGTWRYVKITKVANAAGDFGPLFVGELRVYGH
ncbi:MULTISPECIES: right-handed parallel beta-helix repeat-containing protein [unclassified Rathayibacter]|uniref:right-handed parallel beta-helix repeat-containing protein n=1 Tax=unclassified Rathayibacter TaxID=2609250 RepID=UPI0006FAC9AA|nr:MULTISPECIES: right-handed parallel beta-helix repeat-containing protein [unclassified Rathayibacter]KQQ06289.1 hypothetical protein ASF42_07200 [Rathayibacter sp. Leaf294]KQS14144.1 hypothetical protein ASG06_07200 [Rathayibacter sp. Leaf185]